MKTIITIILVLALAVPALATGPTLIRDGEGQKIQALGLNTIRTASIGTKGFKCFSTASKLGWYVNAVATVDGTNVPFKYFINGSETLTFTTTAAFEDWQSTPSLPTKTSVCLRGYSSATAKTAVGIFQ